MRSDVHAVHPERLTAVLEPDPRRVLARPFIPGEWGGPAGTSRVATVIDRVLAIPEGDIAQLLAQVHARFAGRHRDLDAVLERHGALGLMPDGPAVPADRMRLLGAYFTQEYAVEGAALTNPSMVAAPDVGDAAPGELPFVMSVRAIGEGHISSIVFRTGVLDGSGGVRIDDVNGQVVGATRREPQYDRVLFGRQLIAAGADHGVVASVMGHLPGRFSMEQLESWLRAFIAHPSDDPVTHEVIRLSHWLASANYIAAFPDDSQIGDRVLFPAGPTESRGMEDARFVRFLDEDGSVRYFATYTAYDGFTIRPQLIETADFTSFRISTLNGVRDQTKGMALFPRRIDGHFVALTRPDRESIAVATSDHPREWVRDPTIVWRPGTTTWDLVQLGNNGSPIETEAGWLVLTHGVGAMRRYVLGALLLDLQDPTRPLGYLPHALLEPSDAERDGYVPNVVYSCGGLVHGGRLVVPYGFSDVGTAIATFPLDEVLDRLTTVGRRQLDAA